MKHRKNINSPFKYFNVDISPHSASKAGFWERLISSRTTSASIFAGMFFNA